MELKKLNYNFSYNGTKYLAESIYQSYHMQDIYNINLNKDVYTIVAKKYNKSVNNIKCNITHATKWMYYDCDEKTLEEYYRFFYRKKPTVKEVIVAILNNL